MRHAVPALAPSNVEDALRSLGYTEPELDTDLPEDPEQRTQAMLTVLLAVTEAHLAARPGTLGEAYFSVSDHLAEVQCGCDFGRAPA